VLTHWFREHCHIGIHCAATKAGLPDGRRSTVSQNSQHAYNSVWQLRGDAWCRLEEAADRLTRTTTTGELKDEYVGICQALLATLTPLEPYWAYPGTPQFAKVQRQFTAGNHDEYAHAVARINRALTTESYRSGELDTAHPPAFASTRAHPGR
jgi:arginine decarboxylase